MAQGRRLTRMADGTGEIPREGFWRRVGFRRQTRGGGRAVITSMDDEVVRMLMDFAKRCRAQGMTGAEIEQRVNELAKLAADNERVGGSDPPDH